MSYTNHITVEGENMDEFAKAMNLLLNDHSSQSTWTFPSDDLINTWAWLRKLCLRYNAHMKVVSLPLTYYPNVQGSILDLSTSRESCDFVDAKELAKVYFPFFFKMKKLQFIASALRQMHPDLTGTFHKNRIVEDKLLTNVLQLHTRSSRLYCEAKIYAHPDLHVQQTDTSVLIW